MATTAPEAAANDAETPAKSGKGKLMMILAAVGGLVLGAGGGVFVLGPRLAPHAPAEASAEASAEAEHAEGGEGEGEKEGKESGEKKVVKIDNLIVNPAGSQGARFLMTSVAFEVGSKEDEEKLREREVELRDAIVSVLSAQTLDQLTEPSARDSLKLRLAAATAPLLGAKAKVRVYLPQFVIQ